MIRFLVFCAALGAAASAFAYDPFTTASEPAPYTDSFSALDANRDGVLTFSEVFGNPKLSNNFTLLDKNADGVLSREEVRGLISLR
ncbi:MAG TPA: hypothetical protein VFB08_08040 [Burkholderiales bacterium]|nr:hypothetical protein [Burkholderiales bacterium]